MSLLSKILTDHAALPSYWIGSRKRFSWASWADVPSPLVCLSLERPFFLALKYFQVPATQATFFGMLVHNKAINHTLTKPPSTEKGPALPAPFVQEIGLGQLGEGLRG